MRKPTKKPLDLVGKKFDMLTVLKFSHFKPRRDPRQRDYYWLCKCTCGNECVVSTNKLRMGQRSCGCMMGRANMLEFGRGFLNKIYATYRRMARGRNLTFKLPQPLF